MKKIISLLLVIIILYTSIGICAYADTKPVLEIVTTESTSNINNPSTDIKFYLNNAKDVVTASCTVEYDSDMMAVAEVHQVVPAMVGYEIPKFPPIVDKVKPGEMILLLDDAENCDLKEFSYINIIPRKDGKTTVTVTDIKAYDAEGNEIEVEVPSYTAELSFTIDIDFSFDEETKTLYINGSGSLPDYILTNDYEYCSVAPYADYVNDIEHVVIGEGIVQIGSFSFTDSVKTVRFPDSLESIVFSDLPESGDQIWYGKAFSDVEFTASLAKRGIPRGSKNIDFIATDIEKSGDLNKDNEVNAADALFILKICADMCEESGCLFTPDVNKDDDVNAKDALEVLKIAAKLI